MKRPRCTSASVKSLIYRHLDLDYHSALICRMSFVALQGPGTDAAPLAELCNATRLGKSCVVQLLNYRRNGDAFVNYLSVTPIHNDAGVLTHYVGIQSDITELVNHKKAELAAKHAAVQVPTSICKGLSELLLPVLQREGSASITSQQLQARVWRL